MAHPVTPTVVTEDTITDVAAARWGRRTTRARRSS